MSEDVATKITVPRLVECLSDIGITGYIGPKGEVGAYLSPNFFVFSGGEGRPHVSLCEMPRSFNIQHVTELLDFVTTHNRDKYSPKLFTLIDDDGEVQVRASHVFGWTDLANSTQIREELMMVLRSTGETFDLINSAFPDKWA